MELTYIVLIILAVIYVPLFLYVKFGKKLEEKGLVPYGPTIMIRTKLGIKLIDRWGKYTRFWRACGVMSRFVTLFLMAYIVLIIIVDLILLPSAIGKGGMGIEYALAIPGLNPMLPIVYGWIGLIIAMVVHELAHGMQSRANDIPVDSTGLLYAVVPVGAFVEPNEEAIEKSSRRARMDLYAAGITTNFIVALIMFVLMFSMASGSVTSDYDDNPAFYAFTKDSPMLDYDIPTTAIITDIDGTTITKYVQFEDLINAKGYGQYSLTYVYKGDKTTLDSVTLGTFINGVTKDSPAEGVLEKGDYIISLQKEGSEPVKIGTPTTMTDFLKNTTSGETITITFYDASADTTDSQPLKLGDNNGIGFIGISTTLSGISFTTPGTILNTGINPYYKATDLKGYVNGTISYLAAAFNGFSPVPESTHWWYHGTFIDGDTLWIIMSLLYWIFWLNIVLAVTNALPAVPFDGGFLFAGGVEFIVEKFVREEEKKERIVNAITTATTYFMLLALILVLVVIIF